MAIYRFTCCNENFFLDGEQLPSVLVEHNCQGVPCLALAVSATVEPENVVEPEPENVVEPKPEPEHVPEADIASPELNAALDQVPVVEKSEHEV